jgi:serine/threonine protein kinase/serine/threonine protein phosphatase PrpC
MTNGLKISIGQHSCRGRKETNQDFHGALIPEPEAAILKGIAIVLADGISSSPVSAVAAEAAVKSFLTDYYCTSESWPVKSSAERVISAANAWLHSKNKRSQNAYDLDRGYICTLSAMILKSRTAHIFHVGDSRIYRITGGSLEQLTEDHRVFVSSGQSYLGRALGVNPHIEIDYRAVPLETGDIFVLATDGVYEHIDASFVSRTVNFNAGNLDLAAEAIVREAHRRGSEDNLTVQILRIETVPDGDASDFLGHSHELMVPPLLDARMEFDGYRIVREIHASSRSHVYLAEDLADGCLAAVKIPSIDLRSDAAYLKRFMMEEWIARRLNSAHVLKNHPRPLKKNYLYLVTEFVDGQTLTQWMIDHPRPDLETVRIIAAQIIRGLRAFHRMEMVHQDLRPENILIDRNGTVKIIDFGSVKVTGVIEAERNDGAGQIPGTLQYAAPEYFIGEGGTPRSDLFSLGVICYQMLTGKLPYGAGIPKIRTRTQLRKLRYIPARSYNPTIPLWMDGALMKAVHPDPGKRYQALSEFEFDLRNPNSAFLQPGHIPLAERDPVRFWKVISLFLACIIIFLLIRR